MNTAEIRDYIRRGIREPSPRMVSDDDIDNTVLEGVKVVGLKIKAKDQEFYNVRSSLASNTHVFSWPSDCATIIHVWDMDTNAGDITAASNASPIVITSASHGFSDGDIVIVHGVLGNTAANGTWKVANKTDDTFELYGSTGNAAWTSGGKVFEAEGAGFERLSKIAMSQSTMSNDTVWFPRGKTIVVDDPDFTNDLVIDYEKKPSVITDIPDEYHMALVSFGVIHAIRIPAQDQPDYPDKVRSLQYFTSMYDTILGRIDQTLRTDTEPYNLPDEWGGDL